MKLPPTAYLSTILSESLMLQARREIAFGEWCDKQHVKLNEAQWIRACSMVSKGEAFDCAYASVRTNPWLR
jgi:hypothetical protein